MNNTMSKPKHLGRPPAATLAQGHPTIAAQLVDQTLATQLSQGSAQSVEWQCNLGHRWYTKVYNRTNAKNHTGCPVCKGKIVLAGYNDVATTHPNVAALFADQALITTVTAFSNKKVLMRCAIDASHEWDSPPSRIATGQGGCPFCSGRRSITGKTDLATTHPKIAAMLVDQSLATTLKAGSNIPAEWQCPEVASHTWVTDAYSLTGKGTGCPYCSGRIPVPGVNDLATTHPALAAQLKDPRLASTISKGHDKNVEWVCVNDPSHVWLASPCNRIKGVGCRFCANREVLLGFNDLAATNPELVDRLVDPTEAHTVTAGTSVKLTWTCAVDPTHRWNAIPSRLLSPRPAGCSQCFRAHRSQPEIELATIVTALLPGVQIITNDRTTLGSGFELDIIIPDKHIAIEFNGVYWHSEAQTSSRDYHAEKTRRAHEAGYRLIHIWEDDWCDHREIVVRGLAHRLGATHNLLTALPDAHPLAAEKVFARKLHTTTVTGAQARAFWKANHIQGPVGSSHYLALCDDNDQIRALLGVGRKNHGSRAPAIDGVWDIQRYATYGVIPGGFSRLLKHATAMLLANGQPVTHWTSYSNNDVSDGGMYQASGFTIDKIQPPSYSYVGTLTQWRRAHRTQFTRQRFEKDPELMYEDGWTEHQAAQANRLYRVYDAGKTRWLKMV